MRSFHINANMFKPIFIVNDNVDWYYLWDYLSQNPNAIYILEQHLDKVNWSHLSHNPNAIPLLEKHLDKVNWSHLSHNPNAIHLLATLDTVSMRTNCKVFAEELTAYVFHPTRLHNMSNAYGFELEEYIEHLM